MNSFSLARASTRANVCHFPRQNPARSSTALQLSARGFHATPRRPLLDECLIQTRTIIIGLHDLTGLPWAASIPLTGLALGVLVRLPISLYIESIMMRQNELVPHVAKYQLDLQKKIMQDKKNTGKDARYKAWLVHKDLMAYYKQLSKEKRIEHWRTWVILLKFPIWLMVMDCLRSMTGTQEGFLALIRRSFSGRQGLEQTLNDSVVHLEPSFATEGALWFPNLSLPDPSLILPFVVSGSIFAVSYSGIGYIRWRGIFGYRSPYAARLNVWGDRIRNFMTLAVGPATLQFPSAMLLFWISSNLSVVAIGYIHRWYRPNPSKAAIGPKKSDAKKQQYRGPTMQDLRAHRKGKK